jgi:hypothetical protein
MELACSGLHSRLPGMFNFIDEIAWRIIDINQNLQALPERIRSRAR